MKLAAYAAADRVIFAAGAAAPAGAAAADGQVGLAPAPLAHRLLPAVTFGHAWTGREIPGDQRPVSGISKTRPWVGHILGSMKQSVSLITLGVADYERAKEFYEAIGWSPAMDIEETAFFQANGVVLVLWSRERLAADMGVADDGARWGGVALAHNVASEEEVASVIEEARANGAEIIREPSPTFYGGYAGGFRDADGHVWEVAHNPGFGLTDEGSVVLPER